MTSVNGEADGPRWTDPEVRDARERLSDVATAVLMIEAYGTPHDILEASRKLHVPRLTPELRRLLDEWA